MRIPISLACILLMERDGIDRRVREEEAAICGKINEQVHQKCLNLYIDFDNHIFNSPQISLKFPAIFNF